MFKNQDLPRDYQAVLCLVDQSCLTLRPHRLLPARLRCPWGFSRKEYWSGLPGPSPGESSQPRDRTQVSHISGRFFTIWATREDPENTILSDISQTKTSNIWYQLYVESKEVIQMNWFMKQKQTLRLWKQTYNYRSRNLMGHKLGVWD